MENGIILRKLLQPQWHNLSPLEIKLFLNLFWLADPDDYNLQLSLNALSKKVFSSNKGNKTDSPKTAK